MNNTKTTSDDSGALFSRLHEFIAGYCTSMNQNERCDALIMFLIGEEDIHGGSQIVGILRSIGLKREHAGARLNKGAGADSSRHRWWKDSDRLYHLHADA